MNSFTSECLINRYRNAILLDEANNDEISRSQVIASGTELRRYITRLEIALSKVDTKALEDILGDFP